jgi:hypothetical protein
MEKKKKKVTKPKSLFERLKEKTKTGMNHDLENTELAMGMPGKMDIKDAENIVTEALHAGSYSKALEVILDHSDNLPKLMLLAAEFGVNFYRLEIEAERKRMMVNVINRIAQGGKTININKE